MVILWVVRVLSNVPLRANSGARVIVLLADNGAEKQLVEIHRATCSIAGSESPSIYRSASLRVWYQAAEDG